MNCVNVILGCSLSTPFGAGGGGKGYVTLVLGDGQMLTEPKRTDARAIWKTCWNSCYWSRCSSSFFCWTASRESEHKVWRPARGREEPGR